MAGWLERHVLAALLLGAFMMRATLGALFPNVHFPDEIFQVVEPAYRALSGSGMVAWEFEVGARSWLWPGIVSGVMWGPLTLFGTGPHIYYVVVVLCVLVSLIGVAAAYGIGRQFSLLHAVCAGVAVAIWHELVFYSVHPFSEAVAVSFLLAALFFAGRAPKMGNLLAAGFFLSLTLVLRLQLAPGLLVVAGWMLWRIRSPAWLWMVLGGVPAVLVAGAIDWITWGAPFHSYIANFTFNVVEDGASTYGVSPPLTYIRSMIASHGAYLPVLGVLVIAGARKAPLPLLVAIAIIATHSLIAHKEQRFIIPAVACLIVVAGLGLADLIALIATALKGRSRRFVAAVGIPVFIATSFSGMAASQTNLHAWTNMRPLFYALWNVEKQPDVCGVGMHGQFPSWSPGSSALPADVPIYYEAGQTIESGASYNVLVTFGRRGTLDGVVMLDTMPPQPPGFEEVQCFDAPSQRACLLRRPGGCRVDPEKMLTRYVAG